LGKRDRFLDYGASRKYRDKVYQKQKNRGKSYNGGMNRRESGSFKTFVAVLAASLLLGVAMYLVASYVIGSSGKTEPDKPYVIYASAGTADNSIGPYGLDLGSLEAKVTDVPKNEGRWMADFVDDRTPVKAKGIYLTFEGITKLFDQIMKLIDQTELNTVIIDVKDDEGNITFAMNGPLIDEYKTSWGAIPDIKEAVGRLKEHDVYIIARIVSFKDQNLGKKRPDLLLHMKDGTVYKDRAGGLWLDPFRKEALNYLVEIAKNCAEAGFDEVNFDYIRYPTDGLISNIDLSTGGALPTGEAKTKIDAVTEAVIYLCENIKPMGLFVSADVFGGIITSVPDQRNVGQVYSELSKYLDYICPMIYPSHYGNGYYGVQYPDTQPYTIVYKALADSAKALDGIDEGEYDKAIVRPWLQDFTASYLRHYIVYGAKEVRTQIEAAYDAGYQQWFLWNAAMKYTKDALMTEAAAEQAYINRPEPTKVPEPTRSPQAAPTRKPSTGEYYDSPWKGGSV